MPQGPLAIHPGATALQYAQVMFFKFQIKICYLTLLFSQSLREWKLCGALMTRSRYYLTTRILNHYIIWQKKGKIWKDLIQLVGKLISFNDASTARKANILQCKEWALLWTGAPFPAKAQPGAHQRERGACMSPQGDLCSSWGCGCVSLIVMIGVDVLSM